MNTPHKQRLGKSRYRTYEFPRLETIEDWSRQLFNSWSTGSLKFSQWEEKFVKDIYGKLAQGIELSEETVWKLEQLYAKYTN